VQLICRDHDDPIVFALRRPITVMLLVLALGLGGLFSIYQMQKDIFPSSTSRSLRHPQLRRDGPKQSRA